WNAAVRGSVVGGPTYPIRGIFVVCCAWAIPPPPTAMKINRSKAILFIDFAGNVLNAESFPISKSSSALVPHRYFDRPIRPEQIGLRHLRCECLRRFALLRSTQWR